MTNSNIEALFGILDHDKNNIIDLKDLQKVLPTNLNKEGKMRHRLGPFFEANEKVGKDDDVEKVKQRWIAILEKVPTNQTNSASIMNSKSSSIGVSKASNMSSL